MKVIISDQDKSHNPCTVLINSKALRRRTEYETMNYTSNHFYNEHKLSGADESKMYIKQIGGMLIIEKSIYYDGDGSETE